MRNSHGTNLKQVSGSSQEDWTHVLSHTHTHTPRASALSVPSAPEPVSCVRTRSSLCLRRPRLWSKASTDPSVIESRSSQNPPPAGICWAQANASNSKSMNSAKKTQQSYGTETALEVASHVQRREGWGTCSTWFSLSQQLHAICLYFIS